MDRRLLSLLFAGAALALPAAPAQAQDTGYAPGEGMQAGVSVAIMLGQWESDRVGIGARVTGTRETFIADARVDEMTGLGGRLYIPLEGGKGLTFKLSGMSGDGSDRFSAPAGGPDDFGFTFLEEQALSGGGTSTGLFVGNSWDVEARASAEATHWNAEAKYDLGLSGPFTKGLSVGLSYDNWDQDGRADGTFSNGGFEIDSETRTAIEEWAAGLSIMYGADVKITPELVAWFTGEAGLSLRNAEGTLTQTTECGFCAPDLRLVEQTREVDDRKTVAEWAFGGGIRYDITENATLEIGVEARNDGPGGFDIPANPDRQPAGFDDDPGVTVTGWAGLNYRW